MHLVTGTPRQTRQPAAKHQKQDVLYPSSPSSSQSFSFLERRVSIPTRQQEAPEASCKPQPLKPPPAHQRLRSLRRRRRRPPAPPGWQPPGEGDEPPTTPTTLLLRVSLACTSRLCRLALTPMLDVCTTKRTRKTHTSAAHKCVGTSFNGEPEGFDFNLRTD